MVVRLKIGFLSMLLLHSLCQGLPTVQDTETYVDKPQKTSIISALKKCCEYFHLAGEKSVFRDFYVRTGTDYTPQKRNSGRCKSCCRKKHTEDRGSPAEAKPADQLAMGAVAYDAGRAEGAYEVTPGLSNDSGGTGITAGVDGGLVDGSANGGTECGPCINIVGECIAQTAHFFCCDLLCGCCNNGCPCPTDCPMA